MNLQTQIPFKKQSEHLINYQSKIFLLGSCFSENIGNKLSYYQFQSTQNPFGILFHPKAIETFITNAINKKIYSEEDLFFQNERWHCFEAHSSLSSSNEDQLLTNLNATISSAKKQVEEATHIIITLGTSWVYRFIKTDTIVANCHKIPQKKFVKKLLTIDEISESLDAIIKILINKNPTLKIIFTVSPVRHLKDGFVENQRSKSHLIAGIHALLDSVQSHIHYFPSYELMMDELRDYRFYAEDMIHPSQTAINYIWDKFVATWFSEKSQSTMQEVQTIQKGIAHKPFHINSNQHEQFLKKLAAKKDKIIHAFPFMKF
ncbi:GSCFA domain-containing protein [uncultured Polaribacter sp.]|uniref:GSCFA domain-containing protein n=1 Tax=uncultured Polaribacter sp. TaxID=174711 RepID=UPI00262A200C|nr:GSCFA domain-containing protein [uncultured Polaribacter sp.]